MTAKVCTLFVLFFLIGLNSLQCEAKPLGSSFMQQEMCIDQKYADSCWVHESLLSLTVKSPTPQELCQICYDVAPVVRALVKKNETKYFHEIATLVCVGLKLTQEYVCSQAINLFEGPVLAIIRESTLSDKELCSAAIDCGPITNPVMNWNITLPDVPKPPVKPPKPPTPGSPTLRILQISDIHTDLLYQPGALAECAQPLCCRNVSTPANSKLAPQTANQSAGYWGDYRNCDVPIWTVENMFQHISANEEFDFIYWTGDLPPHNVWNQSRSDQINALDTITDLFQKYFGNKVIYPTLGNHEATPVNLYPPPYVKEDNITWLYTELARDWTKTGLPSYLEANISQGAFYTLQIASGLRLVSMNMNYCPGGNFWLYINSTDPLGQLQWLADVLQESENIGEKVHIIGHHHPSSCLDSWSQNYYRIANRYESTIVGQFFGHSHVDEFEIFYDLDDLKRATGIAYICGSVTTYSYLNPSYRIYTVDGVYTGSSLQVLDHETYIMNLTDANLNGPFEQPKWKLEYSAKDAFNMTNVYPQDWADLIDRMLADLDGPLVDSLLKFNRKSADVNDNCDHNCRRGFVCDFKQARADSFVPC